MSEKSFFAVSSVNRSSVRILIGEDILAVFVSFCKRSYPRIFKNLKFAPITYFMSAADEKGVEVGYTAWVENNEEEKTAIATILPLVEERIVP